MKQAILKKITHSVLTSSSFSEDTSSDDDPVSAAISLPKPLRKAFTKHDPEHTGTVKLSALKEELGNRHFRLTDEEIEQMCDQLSADANGIVDWESWVAAMSDWQNIRSTSDWDQLVGEAFSSLDIDQDASLGVEDLAAILCSEEGCLAEDDVEAALREADSDGDGMVTLQDFEHMLAAYGGDLTLFDSRISK